MRLDDLSAKAETETPSASWAQATAKNTANFLLFVDQKDRLVFAWLADLP